MDKEELIEEILDIINSENSGLSHEQRLNEIDGLLNQKKMSEGEIIDGLLPMVTRVEVIDQDGRSYVNWDKDNIVTIQLQDDGRTLKIFIDRVK